MSNLYNLLRLVVRPGEPPAEFEPEFYRLVYDDLAAFDETALRHHFENHGRQEGRIGSPSAHRSGFLALVPPRASVLEIGPFTKPSIRGKRVKYFDVMTKAELLVRAAQHGQPTAEAAEIDYVSPIGDLGVVDHSFDVVFSSHCIEHQPDLVHHLVQVEKILKRRGRYMLIIPDKRYCFDALIPESTFAAVQAAFHEGRRVHTWESVYEHRVLTTHNDTARHWAGDSADPAFEGRAERTKAAEKEYREAKGGYIDVHAWQFTPASFRSIIDQLYQSKLTKMSVERVYDTVNGRNEFCAVLRKN